ncbi:MAG TPA: S8/S53 family peptidase [Ktedonosporobacter sp.]|nr:S8/S53 family peptidase [Ktedonosporobacter sp.]
MQPNMPMGHEMHDKFWRDDQIMVVFQSDLPLVEGKRINKKALLEKVNVEMQLRQLNDFLQKERQLSVTLSFLDESKQPAPGSKDATPGEHASLHNVSSSAGSQEHAGIYLFGLQTPIQSSAGVIRTSMLSFFRITKGTQSTGDVHANDDPSLILAIVNALNGALGNLRNRNMPIAFSAPSLLSGGTQFSQGCPLMPPLPVEDESCLNWHITLPDLDDDSPLASSQGKGVTVFILDALPERGVIARASEDAEDANPLLHIVNETVKFDYSLMSGLQEIVTMASTGNAGVGKDVYGMHYRTLMPDHGLFIAGIVRDIAPQATIECVRVLDGLCVGDIQTLSKALEKINNRMLSVNPDTGKAGNLHDKPVVINLSLVFPTVDDLAGAGIDVANNDFGSIIAAYPILSLSALTQNGALIVASSGNEGDPREMPEYRPPALYPAAIGDTTNAHHVDGVIAVGAVNGHDQAASYACYPGNHGIGTYGGEIPAVKPADPLDPGSDHPVVTVTDALRGLYSSVEYPPLVADPTPVTQNPAQYYTAPNTNAWAYWIGSSFATPIVSAAAARILANNPKANVYDTLLNLPSGRTVRWDNIDPNTVPAGFLDGPILKAVQVCLPYDDDEGKD